jgi:hypothetical protein
MKPLQGAFDLVEGTASAVKEVVGGPPDRKVYFSESRNRLPRCCTSLLGHLPAYSGELAVAQQELLRINLYRHSERLLDTFCCALYFSTSNQLK